MEAEALGVLFFFLLSFSFSSSSSFFFRVILISLLTNLPYTTPKPPKALELWSCLSLFQFLVLYLSLKLPFMFILTCYYSIKRWEGERGGGDFP